MTALVTNTQTLAPADVLEVVDVHLSDPRVEPMLEELAHEYSTRYHESLSEDEIRQEMVQYPAEEFVAPVGGLVLLLANGTPIAGGAFRARIEPELGDPEFGQFPQFSRDAQAIPAVPTAELKRIWTHHGYRRQGLGQRILDELEARIRRQGYQRIYLTTGPKQPEAEGLYIRTGYTPLYPVANEYTDPLPFEKWLTDPTIQERS